jgi:diamine N-acetyltransferase
MDIEIRQVTNNESVHLQSIARQTFSESFSSYNSEENMTKYLEDEFSPEKLKSELTDKDSEFYFSLTENKIIGYLKINSGHSQTDLKDENALEIERIYILKEFQGKKIGQLLFKKAMEIAVQKSADFIWLGVWEKNQGAIRFYRKNGFVEFDQHIFRLGNDEQTDIMMKLDLTGTDDRKINHQ